MHIVTTNGLENPPDDPFWHGDRALLHGAELGQIRRDLVAMTVLFRLLSYAVVVRSMESRLEAVVGEEEEDAGPSLPPMAPDDWIAYC